MQNKPSNFCKQKVQPNHTTILVPTTVWLKWLSLTEPNTCIHVEAIASNLLLPLSSIVQIVHTHSCTREFATCCSRFQACSKLFTITTFSQSVSQSVAVECEGWLRCCRLKINQASGGIVILHSKDMHPRDKCIHLYIPRHGGGQYENRPTPKT
jgi:hypothetical protein